MSVKKIQQQEIALFLTINCIFEPYTYFFHTQKYSNMYLEAQRTFLIKKIIKKQNLSRFDNILLQNMFTTKMAQKPDFD